MFKQSLHNCLLRDHEHIYPTVDHCSKGIFLCCEVHKRSWHETVVHEFEIIVIGDSEAIEPNILSECVEQEETVDCVGDKVDSIVRNHH